MASNLTIESPNFEKITKEAGDATADAVNLLWAALNDTRKTSRTDFRQSSETISPKVLTLAPSADVDNLDSEGASVIHFNGASSVNFSGIRAPDTGRTRVIWVYVSGAGTITLEHETVSETENQITCASGANTALATRGGAVLVYLGSKWKELI